MQTPSKTYLINSVKACGLPISIIKRVLPSWWHDDLFHSNTGMMQFCLLMRNRLGLNAHFSEEGKLTFTRHESAVEFKKNANIEHTQLTNATSFAHGVVTTLVRSLQANDKSPCDLTDLEQKLFEETPTALEPIIQLLWQHNIPVLYIDNYPSQVVRPAGMVILHDGFYCIVLSHKKKSPAAQLFILLHEVGHILRGHLYDRDVIADITASELGESLRDDGDSQEIEADEFALNILRRGHDINDFFQALAPRLSAGELAAASIKYGKEKEIHAGHLILSYGRVSSEWPTAMKALSFVERENAKDIVIANFKSWILDLDLRVDDMEFISNAQGI